ncbi:MAG: 30S ribosomal protein S17 [Minisyncoccia bacterium]
MKKTQTTKPATPVVMKKTMTATVVKTAMKDTATVVVSRYEKHPKYQKFMKINKKYLVDDKGNTAQVGDVVTIESTRPISKNKHFKIVK